MKLTKECPNIPYFFFADDCIIFYTSKAAARNVIHILDHYYKLSGQLVNLQKSKIQFQKD